MFNLLPQQDQRDLVSEYRLRFAVITLLLFCALGIIALAALAPSFVASYQKEILTKSNIEILKSDVIERSKDKLADTLAFTAKEIKVLEQAEPDVYYYEIIANVIQSKTDAIKIIGVHAARGEGGSRNIVVSGQAIDRDSLLEFKRILEGEKMFGSVLVPPSNFAPAADINFSIFIKTK